MEQREAAYINTSFRLSSTEYPTNVVRDFAQVEGASGTRRLTRTGSQLRPLYAVQQGRVKTKAYCNPLKKYNIDMVYLYYVVG